MDLDKSESKDRQRERYLRALKSGSVREKALLLGNHLLDARAGENVFLTQEDINAIVRSINSDKDIAKYERYKKMITKIDSFLLVIAQCKLSYLIALHEVDKLLVILQKDKDLERITNKILSYTPDTDKKRKIISDIETDNEPYLKSHGICSAIIGHYIDDKDWRLEVVPTTSRHINLAKVKNEQARLKTAIQATKDFMNEKKFKPNYFSKFLKNIEAWVKKDKDELLILKAYEPRSQDIKEPDYNATEINDTLYNQYIEECLNG